MEEALARHHEIAHAANTADGDAHAGIGAFVARVLGGLWLQQTWGRSEVAELIAGIARETDRDPEALGLEVALQMLRDPELLQLPPSVSLEAQLRVALAFGPLDDISLWTRSSDARLRCVCSLGASEPSRRVQAVARQALEDGDAQEESARMLRAVPVVRWGRRHAALVARPTPRHRARSLLIMRAAGEMIGMVLERQALLERGTSRERSLVQASERRFAGIAFDIHDGPLQELAVVAGQMCGVRRDVASAVEEPATRAGLLGRLGELQSRVMEIERGMRSLCHSLQSDGMLRRPFAEVVAGEGEGFTSRTGIPVEVHVSGPVDQVAGAQRIALLRILQECLSNVREHADAGLVRLCVSVGPAHIEASVTDDGRGFDVERTLVRAARRGRLGLVGVHERARLLGGACGVQSTPGGPTKIAIVLPRGEEPAAAPVAGGALASLAALAPVASEALVSFAALA